MCRLFRCGRSVLIAALLAACACAGALAQGSETLSLDGTWQFALAKNEAAARELGDFYNPGYKATGFRSTPVPSNWALEGFEEPHYKPFEGEASQGFYLRHFETPAGFEKKRVLLHFGGVWSSAEVWLNGKPLGRHDSGFTSFAYDVSSLLKAGGDNLLALRVRQTQHDYLFDTNDDWSLGGIYRDVTLEAMPHDRWIDRVDTQTTFDSQFRDADLEVRVLVGDQHRNLAGGNVPEGPGEPYELKVALKDATGREVQSQTLKIPPHYGTDRQSLVRLHVEQPLHWTAETPNLYSVEAVLLEGGKPAHERMLNVGFRQISTTGGVFRINGQAVKFRGVDRHDEYPDVGRATTPDIWLKDLKLMKAANINFIRTSHYPPNAGFLDLCDTMGMYVEDEVPMGFGGDHANDPSFTATVMQRSYETVSRDLNHASIVLWSIGNEDPLTALHIASARTVKALDPTRPVLMPWRTEQWMPEEFDILAPHYLTAQQMDEIGARSTRPVLMTEYTHAFGTDGFGGLDERWKALTKHPAGLGGAIWMWADQGIQVVKQNPDGTTSKSLRVIDDGFDGIVGPYREPQRDYWETKAVYAQAYPAVDAVALTSGQASVRIPIQNDFDFTDLSTVKIAWKLFADAKQMDSGSMSVAAPPHATGWLELPAGAMRQVAPGRTYYAQLTFLRPDGSEITSRSVELTPREPAVTPRVAQKITVKQTGGVAVSAGDATFTFNPGTGELVSATWKGARVLTGMKPTIWGSFTPTDAKSALREAKLDQMPDLGRFTAKASAWKVDQQSDKVLIHATVICTVDEKNRFTVEFEYTIDDMGRLSVHYSVAPEVQVHWLPQVGMAVEVAPGLTNLRWFGLGPLDTFPNEKAAGMLGVWPGTLGSESATGTKGTRWVEVGGPSGSTVRFENAGYMRLDAKAPGQVELLSALLGRSTKGRRPEDPEQQLNVSPGKPFVGELSIDLRR